MKYRVDVVVSWGSAAGLSPQAAAGDLLIPESVKVGNSMIDTYDNFNQRLIAKLPAGVTLHRNPIAESPVVLHTIHEKEKMYHATGCIAADMESGTLAQMANLNNIPFAVVRSVSDEANMPLPVAVLNSFPQGTFHLPAFLRSALVNPIEWPQITKLMLNF